MKPILEKMPVIAGPCVLEDEAMALEVAQELKRQLAGLPIELYFKASFDKANRTSIEGFRGPGLKNGLKTLELVRAKTGLSLMTDFHTAEQAEAVAEVSDFIQVPAFLCRQTDMVAAAVRAALKYGRRLNIKKGQFLAPWDAKNIIEKVQSCVAHFNKTENLPAPKRSDWFFITERGVSFGYNTLVVDMLSFQCIQNFGVPVIYDATHSVQVPGLAPGGKSTGGKREYLESLSRAAMAAGADGLFIECHPHPERAKSDGPNSMPLQYVGEFVRQMVAIHDLTKAQPRLLENYGK